MEMTESITLFVCRALDIKLVSRAYGHYDGVTLAPAPDMTSEERRLCMRGSFHRYTQDGGVTASEVDRSMCSVKMQQQTRTVDSVGSRC